MATHQSISAQRRVKRLEGRRFGRLVALYWVHVSGRSGWMCQCDCGRQHSVETHALTGGRVISCGCRQRETQRENGLKLVTRNRTHGMKGSTVYKQWSNMKERCLRPGHKSYADYGGRGIKVCERWMKFENFYADMGDSPEGYTIERKDVNGNYEPDNCRWATWKEQYRNRRDSRLLTAFGETKTAVEWLEDPRCNVTKYSMYKRIENGWPHERVISQPMRSARQNSRKK
jgi:hypothetical protein